METIGRTHIKNGYTIHEDGCVIGKRGRLYIDATVSKNLMVGSAQLHELRREYNLVAASSFVNTALYAMNVSHIKAAKIITQILAVHKSLYGELTGGN